MDGADDESQPPAEDASVILFLGLYLLLVAFFIMLNSISDFDAHRIEDAVASVRTAFPGDRPTTKSEVRIAINAGTRVTPDEFTGDLRAAFEEYLPDVKIPEVHKGGVLAITLPAESLFLEGRATFHRESILFLTALASVLRREDTAQRRIVEITLERSADRPANSAPGSLLEVQRAGTLARALVEHGVRPEAVVSGVQTGTAEMLTLVFTEANDETPNVTFEQLLL